MDPREILARQSAFIEMTGGIVTRIDISLTDANYFAKYPEDSEPVSAFVYAKLPNKSLFGHGESEQVILSVGGETWEILFEALAQKWGARLAQLDADLTHQMAVAIIDLTEKNGECSDAALRQRGFSDMNIERLSVQACVAADKLARNGPFRITSSGKSNQMRPGAKKSC